MKITTLPTEFPPEIESLLQKKDEEITHLTKRVNWFEEQFRLLKSKHYAKSSETHNTLQLALFDEDEENLEVDAEAGSTEEIAYTRKKPNRPQKNIDTTALPREKRYIDLPDEEKQCACGACMQKCGEQSKEELVFKPATFKVIEHIRIQYTCRKCETIKMAKAIELPILKSKAGSSLICEVMLNKYRYHLPFYRQSKVLKQAGLKIADNTMAGWVMQAAAQLEPLRTALFEQLSTVKALQVDETPVKVLKPDKKAYMWLYHSYLPGKRFVIFDFSLGRSSEVVNARLKDFKGLLQTDGYSGYNTQRAREDVVTLGCWDHARRKFTDVVKVCGNNKSGKAGQMLKKISKLYGIEADLKTASPEKRKAERQATSKPLLESIKGFLDKINAPPRSLLGVAATYCKNQWDELTRYVDYGEANISNCGVENQVRPFAVGRRNWLFVGNEGSASKAALIYSLIQSCIMNDLDPRAYLEAVLDRVHDMRRKRIDPATLLPHTINPALLKKSGQRQV